VRSCRHGVRSLSLSRRTRQGCREPCLSRFYPWSQHLGCYRSPEKGVYRSVGAKAAWFGEMHDRVAPFDILWGHPTHVLGESRRPRVVVVVEPAVVVKSRNLSQHARDLPGRAAALHGKPTRRGSLSRNRILASGSASFMAMHPEPRCVRVRTKRARTPSSYT
jgi:hypothetical protein